jgi:hypothetical protein
MDSNPDFKLSLDMMVHVLRFLDPVNILAMRAVGWASLSGLPVKTLTHRRDLDMPLLLSNGSVQESSRRRQNLANFPSD